MVQTLSERLVQQPLHVLLIAAANLALWAAAAARPSAGQCALGVCARVVWLRGVRVGGPGEEPRGGHPRRPAPDLALRRARHVMGSRSGGSGCVVAGAAGQHRKR